MSRAGAAAAAAVAVVGGGLAAYFLLPMVLGKSASCPAGNISTFDSYAGSVTVVNAAQPGVPLLGPTRVFAETGPYDTTNGQGTVTNVVYAWFYGNDVPAAFLVIQVASYGGSTSNIATWINPTGSEETLTGPTGLTSVAAQSVTAIPTPPT